MCCRFKQRQRFGHAQRAAVERHSIECGERAVGVWAISLLVAAELLCLLRCATILGTTPRLLGTTLGSAPLRAPLVALVDRGLVAKLRKACCMFASGDVAAAGTGCH